jgi:hypothetical protein
VSPARSARLLLDLSLGVALLAACGPATPVPATQPIVARPPASAPASQPATGPVPWVTERCRGPLPRLASMPPATQPVAPPLGAAEAAALKERGLLLEPARLRHLVVARGGHLELHRKPAPNGNGKGRGNGGKQAGTAAPAAPGPGVVCVPIAEADLLPLPGCERLHLCAEEGAYALVVETGGRPALARGVTVSLGAFAVRTVPAPEAGEQIVWQATERGLDPTHELEREEILRPKGLRLRHVFGRVVASSVHETTAPGGPASLPAGCRHEPLLVRCGDERYAWDGAAFEYRLAVPAGLAPYRPHEVATGATDPVRALYAALHAASAVGVALQRRGFECVEAQTAYELWSRWPVRDGKAAGPGEVWRVSVASGRVTVEILPFVADDDGLPRVRGVKPDHAYARERAFLAALEAALARPVEGPPKGLEGFRCGAGFGQPIADVSLGAGAEKVRTREQRWRRKCDKTPAQVKRAAAAKGGKVRFTCERDKVVRTYEFAAGSLVAATERYPADGALRHLRRAVERWIARFGSPGGPPGAVGAGVETPPGGAPLGPPGPPSAVPAKPAPPRSEADVATMPGPVRWRWRDRELTATRLPDGGVLFEHRLAPAPASRPAVSRPAGAVTRTPRP